VFRNFRFVSSRFGSRHNNFRCEVPHEKRVNSIRVEYTVEEVLAKDAHRDSTYTLESTVLLEVVSVTLCLTGFGSLWGGAAQLPSMISMDQSEPSSSVTTFILR
jgi:hypothetical protein